MALWKVIERNGSGKYFENRKSHPDRFTQPRKVEKSHLRGKRSFGEKSKNQNAGASAGGRGAGKKPEKPAAEKKLRGKEPEKGKPGKMTPTKPHFPGKRAEGGVDSI